jgi:hypothetical protein
MANYVDCQPPCDVAIGVSWKNNDSTRSGSFYPAIKINGARIPFTSPEEPIPIGPGVTIAKIFNVLGLGIGSYTICPDPNQ